MAYTKYSLTPANNTAAPPDGAPEGMLPSAVNDTMRDMMAQIRDCGDGIRDGTYTMTAPKITGGTITGATVTSNTFSSSGATITGGTINNTAIGGTTAAAGKFTTLEATGVTTVQAGTVSLPAITTSGDTNTGIFFPAADTIAFTEGGVESMRINSSGDVGISTSSPAYKLHVSNYMGLGTQASAGSGAAINFIPSSTLTNWLVGSNYSVSGAFEITPSTAGGGSTFSTPALLVNSSGNVLIGKTSATANGGDLQVSSGITFPATQVAKSDANTLDDYEEGTWTPTATSGTGSITAYTSTGSYTKIGRMVYLIGQVTLTTVGTAGGRLNISALPFTTANTTARPAVGVVREDNATGVMYYGYLNSNNTTGSIATTADNSVVWTNNYNYSFCFVYQTS